MLELRLLIMWCFGCCPCWGESSESQLEDSGLLNSSKWQTIDGEDGTQYYTVRRISSFGHEASAEDISDIKEPEDIKSPAELWTTKIHKIQPESTDGEYSEDTTDTVTSQYDSKPPGRWRKALQPFKPRKEYSKSRQSSKTKDLHIPPITISSPDLKHEEENDVESRSSPPGHLRHAGTLADISSISVIHQQAKWLKSQSMQDINRVDEIPYDQIVNKDNNNLEANEKEKTASEIALTYGLDTSLYTPKQTEEISPMSKSNEALSSWKSQDDMCKNNWLPEVACGMIHFTAAYFQKNKKLFVHINRLEGIPHKGEHFIYKIMVRLTILPINKPVRTTKVYKNDLNPEIEEDFEFVIKDPLGKVLRLSVFDADHPGKYDSVGHALFYLEDVIAGRPRRYTMKLYKQTQPDVSPGNIKLSLSFKQETMMLTVLIIEACNLVLSSSTIKSGRVPDKDKYNTYIKVSFFSAGQKMKSKKGSTVSNNRNPNYNETFTFKLSSNFLHDCYIVVSVMLKGLLKTGIPIGRIILGPFHYAENQEKTPWGRTLLDEETVTHWFRMYL